VPPPPSSPHISRRSLLSLAQLETKLRLICAPQSHAHSTPSSSSGSGGAPASSSSSGSGGAPASSSRPGIQVPPLAGNPGTAAGMRAPDLSHGLHAACFTSIFRCRSRTHRGPRGAEGGRATLPACKRAASAHAPPSAPTCARAPACLRACMRVNA
jgi:hypothetical protein